MKGSRSWSHMSKEQLKELTWKVFLVHPKTAPGIRKKRMVVTKRFLLNASVINWTQGIESPKDLITAAFIANLEAYGIVDFAQSDYKKTETNWILKIMEIRTAVQCTM